MPPFLRHLLGSGGLQVLKGFVPFNIFVFNSEDKNAASATRLTANWEDKDLNTAQMDLRNSSTDPNNKI